MGALAAFPPDSGFDVRIGRGKCWIGASPPIAKPFTGVKDATPFFQRFRWIGASRSVLIQALIEADVRDLTVVSPTMRGHRPATSAGCLPRKRGAQGYLLLSSFPSEYDLAELYAAGNVELELVPQGTFVERMRCAAPDSAASTRRWPPARYWPEGKETRMIDGTEYVFERRSMAMSRC